MEEKSERPQLSLDAPSMDVLEQAATRACNCRRAGPVLAGAAFTTITRLTFQPAQGVLSRRRVSAGWRRRRFIVVDAHFDYVAHGAN